MGGASKIKRTQRMEKQLPKPKREWLLRRATMTQIPVSLNWRDCFGGEGVAVLVGRHLWVTALQPTRKGQFVVFPWAWADWHFADELMFLFVSLFVPAVLKLPTRAHPLIYNFPSSVQLPAKFPFKTSVHVVFRLLLYFGLWVFFFFGMGDWWRSTHGRAFHYQKHKPRCLVLHRDRQPCSARAKMNLIGFSLQHLDKNKWSKTIFKNFQTEESKVQARSL